uniref:Uncharacterized protein n=1 Tax=Tanacetum cinerariifolium TaxID=118510 RepID=A0A699IDK5_TANCI|nr:hypothetical protein [Tanacetum cinerariifolium]
MTMSRDDPDGTTVVSERQRFESNPAFQFVFHQRNKAVKVSKSKERTTTVKVQEKDCKNLKGIEENSHAANEEDQNEENDQMDDNERSASNTEDGRLQILKIKDFGISTLGGHRIMSKKAKSHMADLRVLLEKEMARINRSWGGLCEQIEQGKKKIDGILDQLHKIKCYMRELPASNRAEMLPCFSRLCAEADIVMSKITDCMKTQIDEYQSRVNARFHELATPLL